MKTEEVPGGVYLCQIGETVSCGACCGLYNVRDPSREALNRLLSRRTERFAQTNRSMDALLRFRTETERRENQSRPLPEFHHCPYLGLIGAERSRVGCLLHSLGEGNGGIDYRSISHYGGLACSSYFCPTYHRVPARYKRILKAAIPDWHLYGMVVTESDWMTAIFEAIEREIGGPLAPEALIRRNDCLESLCTLFSLKRDWPFRRRPERVVHYFFKDAGYERPEINYEAVGVTVSPYDALLRPLETFLTSADDLHAAETRIEEAFRRVLEKLTVV